ncbi:MAG: hypothetical protein IJ945_03965 [Oscillospiraceae bacterium]|nr:hypothetical protein [Oscillospiraceae bacterium]
MKKLFCVLLLLFLLSGCEPAEKTAICNAENLGFSEEASFPKIQKAMLDGGKTIALREGFTVRYYSAEYEFLGETKLFYEGLGKDVNCVFSNSGIFIGEETSLCRIEGEWKLCGGTFFKREGEIIRKLPDKEDFYSEQDVIEIKRSLWAGENIMAFIAGEQIFFYDINEDKIYLSLEIISAEEAEENCIAKGKAPLSGGADAVFAVIEKGVII